MKKIFWTILIFLMGFVFFNTSSTLAQSFKNSFVISLDYNNGALEMKYYEPLTIYPSSDDFVPPSRSYFLYSAFLYDKNGHLLTSSKIDQRGGDQDLKIGTVTIITPFAIKTEHIEIFDDKGKIVTSLPIKNFDFCNLNNICESSLGETGANCLDDCAPKSGIVQPSPTPSTKQ